MSVNSPIVDVACGSYATYAVDEQGHTWGWGLNNYGQLGIQGQVGHRALYSLPRLSCKFADGAVIGVVDDMGVLHVNENEFGLVCSLHGRNLQDFLCHCKIACSVLVLRLGFQTGAKSACKVCHT